MLPASLKCIKTLFSAQVLDHFCLCNLELKASAYQFYQLLHWITTPMAPGEVLDLYREFCGMTRIWRWMKKLKWAGYAGGSNKVKDVRASELAIFCPACPQPGINISDNWREDHAWHVEDFYVSFFFFKFDSPRLLDGFTIIYLSQTETSKLIMFTRTVM
jgi:KDZ transposase family protein